jgi:hypothetical protein
MGHLLQKMELRGSQIPSQTHLHGLCSIPQDEQESVYVDYLYYLCYCARIRDCFLFGILQTNHAGNVLTSWRYVLEPALF